MLPYVYLAIAIVSEVFATTMLKSTDGFRRLGLTGLVLLGYGVSLFLLSKCIEGDRGIKIGAAYAIWAGAGTALVAVLAMVVHHQKLDLGAGAGIALIVAGVVVLNVFSSIREGPAASAAESISTVDRDAAHRRG